MSSGLNSQRTIIKRVWHTEFTDPTIHNPELEVITFIEVTPEFGLINADMLRNPGIGVKLDQRPKKGFKLDSLDVEDIALLTLNPLWGSCESPTAEIAVKRVRRARLTTTPTGGYEPSHYLLLFQNTNAIVMQIIPTARMNAIGQFIV